MATINSSPKSPHAAYTGTADVKMRIQCEKPVSSASSSKVISSEPFQHLNFAFNTNLLQEEWVPCQDEVPFVEQSTAHQNVRTTNPSSCSGDLCIGPQDGWREYGSNAAACLFQSPVVCLVAGWLGSVELLYPPKKKTPKPSKQTNKKIENKKTVLWLAWLISKSKKKTKPSKTWEILWIQGHMKSHWAKRLLPSHIMCTPLTTLTTIPVRKGSC